MIHIQDEKRQNTTFTGFLEQFRSKTHKNISYEKSDTVSDTTVTWIHNEGVVVAVGTQDTATKSPITARSSDGGSISGLARRGAQTARPSRVTYELEQRAGRTQSSITWQVSARGKTEKFPCFMVWWCCMLVVGCKCLQSRGLRLGSCKIGWLASGGCWVGGSKRRQGHDDQRLTASLLVASKVVGSGGSWIVGQRSVVLGMDEGNLAKNPWIRVTLGEESGGGGALRTETRFKRQGQGSPPLGEIETEPNKESLPANPIFNFQEFG